MSDALGLRALDNQYPLEKRVQLFSRIPRRPKVLKPHPDKNKDRGCLQTPVEAVIYCSSSEDSKKVIIDFLPFGISTSFEAFNLTIFLHIAYEQYVLF